MSELLAGYRVIESAQLITGDRLGMMLGDLGADVIKVESPFRGDYIRDFLGQITPHHSPAHLQLNKNKRSVTLDLRTDEGRELFWELLATADVFIDGNAGDACERLGIGYAAQRSYKPDIVYVQISGFGAHGPYAQIPTHGQMMNALAGAMSAEMGDDGLVRAASGRNSPAAAGGTATFTAPAYAAMYVCAALAQRAQSGCGQYVDVSAADVVIANAFLPMTNALNASRIADRSSMPRTTGNGGTKYQFYETKDGKVILFAGIEHHFWEHFCDAVGRPDLLKADDSSRVVDFAGDDLDLRHELQRIFHTRTLDEWIEVAVEKDIALGPVRQTIEELRADTHLAARGLFVEGDHPGAGPFTYMAEAGVVDGQPYAVRRPAPALGEHTDEILGDLGRDGKAVADLRARGIV